MKFNIFVSTQNKPQFVPLCFIHFYAVSLVAYLLPLSLLKTRWKNVKNKEIEINDFQLIQP